MNEKICADMVLINGIIFTSREEVPLVEALAIRQGQILEAGSYQEIKRYISTDTAVIDLKGKFACPGFNDAHIHLMGGGLYATRLSFKGARSPEEVAEKVREKVRTIEEGAWVLGRAWDQTLFPGREWPTKEILDQVAPNNPVFLKRVDGHIAWVNSMALHLAGINGQTKDPGGGEIVRDAVTGEPTGILKESAVDLVSHLIPEPSQAEIKEAIRYALAEARKFGVTSIQDISKASVLEVYEELEREGDLTVRVSEWLELKEDLSDYRILKERFSNPEGQIRFFTLKGYVDGTLGSRTAALIEPYSDDPSTKGLMQISEEKLKKLVEKAHAYGFAVALHAIGDLAVRMALEALESGRKGSGERRDRIEHLQVIRSDDVPRFKESRIIASMQPVHFLSDMRWAEERIGPERSKGAYAWKTIRTSGAILAFGTDWPVESMNPMLGLYAAVTRRSLDGEPQGGWFPEEKMTMEEAIRCYTKWSAYAEGAENRKGTLEKSKYADIVILSKNLLEIDPAEIPSTEVLATIFNGKIIYRKESDSI